MGLLDIALGGVLGGATGGRRMGSGRSPVVNALLLALAAKALQHYMSQRRGGAASPTGGLNNGMNNGVNGGLGGILSGTGGLGGILGSLGGAGALGGLLEQLNGRGLGRQAQSWVSPGPNEAIEPQQLADAIDDDDLEQLAQETGLPKQELLREVSSFLPDAIDQLTPDGRLPTDDELTRLASHYEAQATES